MAAKSFKEEEGGARLAETILQRGAARQLCISVCQSRKIHRLVLTGRHYCKIFFVLCSYIIPHHTFTHRQAEPSEQIFLELQKKLSNRKQSFKQTFISIK